MGTRIDFDTIRRFYTPMWYFKPENSKLVIYFGLICRYYYNILSFTRSIFGSWIIELYKIIHQGFKYTAVYFGKQFIVLFYNEKFIYFSRMLCTFPIKIISNLPHFLSLYFLSNSFLLKIIKLLPDSFHKKFIYTFYFLHFSSHI